MSEERLPTEVSNLPYLKLSPISGHSISYHKSLHTQEYHTASSNHDTTKAEWEEPCLFTVNTNQMLLEPYQLINPYSSYLNIKRNPQGQTRNNSLKFNSLCDPLSWNPNVFTTFTNTVYCRFLSLAYICSWVLRAALFPFSLSPVQLKWEMGGGRRRKRKERVVSWCSYASLPLALSPRFSAALPINKQCLPLVSYHIISK